MAREITVHKGTSTDGAGFERPAAWVVTSIRLELEVFDLVRGLGSEYFRNEVTEDDQRDSDRPENLPASLTQAEILKIYREQFSYWGTNLSTWADDIGEMRTEYAWGWLRDLVTDAFPEMKEYAK